VIQLIFQKIFSLHRPDLLWHHLQEPIRVELYLVIGFFGLPKNINNQNTLGVFLGSGQPWF